jgi:23S rRNA (guanosine2251-2'-O)-methyltransferase
MVEYLYRRNTVLETLRSNRREIKHLWIQEGARQIGSISHEARVRGVAIERTNKQHLSQLAGSGDHQGVLLEVGPYPYSDLEEILALAEEQGEQPFLLLLDLLHGPQNIGALIRTAEACGAHGIILQDRRAPDITPTVVMYSSGATEHLLIAQVTNLVRTIQYLKSADVWVVGLDINEDAVQLGQFDLNMPIAVVVGHEGKGLRRLIRENCDLLIQLPMRGKVGSLNAASAGAIMLYAAWQARGYNGSI